jgi:hypothetical protein
MRAALDARFPVAPSPRVLARRTRRQLGPATYLVVRGSLDVATDAVTFAPFGSITTSQAVPSSDGPYTARLLDSSGNVISQASFAVDLGHGDPAPGASPPPQSTSGNFLVLLPAASGADRVQILDAGSVIGTMAASAHAPTVSIMSPAAGSTLAGASTDVRWHATDADGDPLTAGVQYSSVSMSRAIATRSMSRSCRRRTMRVSG